MSTSVVHKLERVFNPETLAIIGSRQGMGYLWGRRLECLPPFKGRLYSVRVDPTEVAAVPGLRMEQYRSILDIPGPVDQVMFGAHPSEAPQVVRDCIEKRAGGLVVLTPGFAETKNKVAVGIQKEITELARESGLVLLGPNCWGIYNPKIGLFQSWGQTCGEGGTVGFISQSGQQCTNFTRLAEENGMRISKAVGYGNGAVVDSTDYLDYLGRDEQTRIIGMNIEGVKDGRRFFSCLRDVAVRKPVVVWKVGQTEAAARATLSHTGSLAASNTVWQALLRQCGAISVNSLDELVDAVKALFYLELGPRVRMGVVTASGGYMVAVTEDFARAGLEVPELTGKSMEKASSLVSIGGEAQANPFDMSSTFAMEEDALPRLKDMLDILDKDSNIDCVALQSLVGILRLRKSQEVIEQALSLLFDFRRRTSKPFLVVLPPAHRAEITPEMLRTLNEHKVPVFTPEGAARALRRVADYWRFRESGLTGYEGSARH